MTAEQRKPELRLALALAATVMTLCLSARATTSYKVLYDLPYPDMGVAPGVTVDKEGNVYAATGNGGTGKDCGEYGCGLIFELTPQPGGKWTYSLVHDFIGTWDGGGPNGNFAVDDAGNLWGATVGGGEGERKGGNVFELSPGGDGWTMTVLYRLCNQQGCLLAPRSGLVRDIAGNLYGTTPEGGVHEGGGGFEVSPGPDGKWTGHVLHQFPSFSGDGSGPYAGLIIDTAGNLYGTTSYGGTGCLGEGCGTVYELSPESGGKWKETVLHRFDNNGTDGYFPGAGALFMDSSGSLYGTTEVGGHTSLGGGTVFKLTRLANGSWKENILHNFPGGSGGDLPTAGVVMDKAGNLYGTTGAGGGPNGCGVIYKLAPAAKDIWKYSVLHTFGRVGDGCLPSGNLVIDSNGNLYGGTIFGGTHGNGVVFELTP